MNQKEGCDLSETLQQLHHHQQSRANPKKINTAHTQEQMTYQIGLYDTQKSQNTWNEQKQQDESATQVHDAEAMLLLRHD